MSDPQITVGVLMGGPSSEHAISLKSGQGVAAALTQRGWTVRPIIIPHDLSVPDACGWTRQVLQQEGVRVAFIALHGPFGEDGTIQQLCEDAGVAYTGSEPQASRLGMDKLASRTKFEEAGLRVPRWLVLHPAELDELTDEIAALGWPLVVKPTNQGSSIGVSIVREPDGLAEAVAEAARFDTQVLIEEFVPGQELTAGVLDEQVLPVVAITPKSGFFDFQSKYTPGQTTYQVPAPISESTTQAVQAVGLAAHRALGCRHLSRADVRLNAAGAPVILEVNTIPGFTATSLLPKAAACAGISYDDVCERLVRMALRSAPMRHILPAGS